LIFLLLFNPLYYLNPLNILKEDKGYNYKGRY